ncbi:SDR family oxidoreductase [Cellulomonas endophytica]|uniref:SDR family oxidoreductase n=1 Tax=Cellulomonas endophytica TaxID=2494735 RepID=UPI001012B8DE|nr:SDR family NAD(P)-dependent oxidoreductase [Cellulomonas endophytica]
MDITGRTVFIPGATSGIGLALAVALHERGNAVIIGGRRTERLEQIVAEHPGLHAVRIDTADPESIAAVCRQVVAEHPALDTLVAMAGVMRVEDWTRPEGFLASAEEVVTTNVLGPVRLVAGLVEHLRTRPDATIMTVSSGLAFVPLAATPTYNASKAAVHLLSESIRLQLAPAGVRVVEIVPPSVATDLLPGQRESAIAMPLDAFVAEVLEILERDPEPTEVLVERVGFLRGAEARGEYAQVVAALNASDPHASPER